MLQGSRVLIGEGIGTVECKFQTVECKFQNIESVQSASCENESLQTASYENHEGLWKLEQLY